ncbi:hypothetical protein PFUGPA_05365 [Plasmodium falciparum Palo Alto/Uganda]|uniref:Uncharacterized protein n=4 Tax=Plasmodium falciparum TaxID=5833 RepID=W4ISE0_PLAFP|nr:hypothetical protein PFFVO_02249 [Plasmodium falciparum Vietnam Oak-Knoll (FVO)]ETW43453.1 hypothetical protein PFNF135_02365 [Plasmodium falciparum NF135/5.C10]ETW52357.1 hypothetical protein PFUGPA_05365 [Plasmodium falciparum Palo Alto/Uganda]EUR73080.1 hypothetical protein PFBG_02281 [Plasmodium falciparum 7G8]
MLHISVGRQAYIYTFLYKELFHILKNKIKHLQDSLKDLSINLRYLNILILSSFSIHKIASQLAKINNNKKI